jgi:hypothetical protein
MLAVRAIVLPQSGCGVAINRCLYLFGDLVDRHVFGVKLPFAVSKKCHVYNLAYDG